MPDTKTDRRTAKRHKHRFGHKVRGRSVRELQTIIAENGRKAAAGENIGRKKMRHK